MPIFNLADISYGTNLRTGGPSDLIDPAYSGIQYKIKKYPLDIGSYDKGHYMVIHVNEQRKTRFSKGSVPDLPSIIRNQKITGTTGTSIQFDPSSLFSGEGGFMDRLRNSTSGNLGDVIGQFERPIRRTLSTIALYMPDTVQFGHSQSYTSPATTNMITALASAGKSLVDGFNKSGDTSKNVISNMSVFAGTGLLAALRAKGFDSNFINAAQQSLIGAVQNPLLEVIYSAPELRSFRFDFMFYPRSEKEAKEVQDILYLLRFHQAPEILEESAGYFLVPPSEFDIFFYYNGKINPNVPPISTCVLQSIDIDYAPNGWAAYETGTSLDSLFPEMGKTGMPVAIRLSLQFRETEIITKQFIDNEEKMRSARSSTTSQTLASGPQSSEGE